MQIIRKRAVVYVGLDALSDAEVAAAVGNSMFSDLVSVAAPTCACVRCGD